MSKTKHPYQSLPETAFWGTAIADKNMFGIGSLWEPKYEIKTSHKIVTFGSCFAQHFGPALNANGFNWLITEPAPPGLNDTQLRAFGYNTFSCRTGNIYTTSLLNQWVDWALGRQQAPDEYWVEDGRFYDPWRPSIEPKGFCSAEEMFQSRKQSIRSFAEAVEQSDIFVFTLGLTESWFDNEGREYPVCPGTAAGEFDGSKHRFVNQRYTEISKSLIKAIDAIRSVNTDARFLLTVSPVSLVATKSGEHVLSATSYSKSVLRAVAGDISQDYDFVDYFPSFEIINHPVFRGVFFNPNMRTVSSSGVDFVMSHFFSSCPPDEPADKQAADSAFDALCDEELLDAFRAR